MQTHTKTACLFFVLLIASLGASAQSSIDRGRHYEMGKTASFPNADVEVRDGAIVVTKVFARIDGSLPDLKTGDIIRTYGMVSIVTKRDWEKALDAYKPGDRVDIVVERFGKSLTLSVVLDRVNVFKEVI
ncbi:MAG: hypothetical protein JWP27_849 [Flaviaesturariibacter sp.]|nr:hypothetical protein [Flaviaesturariibacter sp.]